ncbi:MAG: ferrochelatase [Candidatus Latescibacterota bacterium]
MKTAVLLSNMGGPDSLEAVEPYLTHIFLDPDIIDLPMPGMLRKRFARWLAHKRAPESTEIYRQIGGRTPLLEITKQQATLLENSLNAIKPDQFSVFVAMRYWHPFLEDVLREIVAQGITRLILVSLYPFYTRATTQYLAKLPESLTAAGAFAENHLQIVDRFSDHPAFLQAMAQQIKDALSAHPNMGFNDLLFSAHSIPLRDIKKGDPYRDEIEAAVSALKPLLPEDLRLHLSYQSKIGPVKWLAPATPDKIGELAAQGVRNLLVYPLGFVADNSETIYEIAILYGNLARALGIEHFVCIEALNANALFIDGLKEIILDRAGNLA